MQRKRILTSAGVIGFLMICLIIIQFVWLEDASTAHSREQKDHVLRALEDVEGKIRNSNYCFEMYGKTYVQPDESFYIVRQTKNSTKSGTIDTVQMYFDTEGFLPDTVLEHTRTFKTNYPATAEIHLNFTLALPSDTDEFYQESKAFYEKVTGKKLRDIISNRKPIEELFNMKRVDSLLRSSLKDQGINGQFGFGFIDVNDKKVVYAERTSDTTALLASPYSIPLFSENKFLKPYRFAVTYAGTSAGYSNIWLLLSIVLIVILIISFSSFVRLYIKQTRLSSMKSDFINNLTHEFNTPMANISLAIESLDDSSRAQEPKIRRMLEIISSESVRLRDNIERALQVATMEKGLLHLRKEEIDMVAIIHTVLSTYQLQCEQLGGTISFVHPPKAIVFGDETHLLNCIYNLLDNAIKYRSDKPFINVQLETGSHVVITVADNGQGMSSETLKHIFDKFYREHQGNLHNTKGFGLGLNYVKGIVVAHGGRISVKSKKGVGTTFTIQLPASSTYESN